MRETQLSAGAQPAHKDTQGELENDDRGVAAGWKRQGVNPCKPLTGENRAGLLWVN